MKRHFFFMLLISSIFSACNKVPKYASYDEYPASDPSSGHRPPGRLGRGTRAPAPTSGRRGIYDRPLVPVKDSRPLQRAAGCPPTRRPDPARPPASPYGRRVASGRIGPRAVTSMTTTGSSLVTRFCSARTSAGGSAWVSQRWASFAPANRFSGNGIRGCSL